MPKPLNIMLGVAPFGCRNVGDEAILECSVKVFRELLSGLPDHPQHGR